MLGGRLDITGTEINIGYSGRGEAAVSGGEINFTSLRVGRENGSYGELTIDGTGVMNMTSAARISVNAGSEGHVYIKGNGQMNVAKELTIGQNAYGTVEVSGGQLNAYPININNGALDVSGGVVRSNQILVNNASSMTLSGGTLVLTNSELGSLDELTIDDGTTVKIDNPGNTTNLHMSSIVLNNGALEVTEGTILDPGYENDELPTTVAIEGDGRVIIRGALFLDAYTTDKATGMDKLDFSGFDGDLTLANPLNLTVHLENANDFLGQVVTLDWLIADVPEELYDIDNVKMTLINDEGISFFYWLNADGTLTFGDHNAILEPSTWALLILGAAGLLYWRKRKN